MQFYYCRNKKRTLSCKSPIGNVSYVPVVEKQSDVAGEKSELSMYTKQLGWYTIAENLGGTYDACQIAKAINIVHCNDTNFIFTSYRVDEKGFIDHASIETQMG